MGRLFKAALICACALLALPLASAAAAPANQADDGGISISVPPRSAAPFGALGHTMLGALAATTNADDALGALANGLALMEARRRLEDSPVPRVVPPIAGKKLEAPPKVVPGDPSTMPPASAGSNGTPITRHSAADREKIFANSRAGGDGSTSILLTGIALPPPDAPQAVKDVINNANTIVGRPYVWGGGHGSFYSKSYDCSGAVSFALFGGGMIPRPLTSSELEGWGAPGPGKWITVYANAGHTFAEIAGLRWDTVGDEQGTGPRWHLAPASGDGFVVRHPPGY
jgi:cell wall-associated NlpC family hydrolase